MQNGILEVNVMNILDNLEFIKEKNIGKEICIPLKANAYGIGIDIVYEFIKNGYTFFAVSTLEEALFLRKISNDIKILLFSAIFVEELDVVEENDITITVYDMEVLKKINRKIKFHLKFDVGMGRLGFLEDEISDIKKIINNKKLNIEGIYTHLPMASNEEKSLFQISKFKDIIEQFQSFNIKYIHYANGLSSLKYDTNFDNLIRPGLIVYGYLENQKLKEKYGAKLKAGADLKVRCSYLKNYSGDVGYDSLDQVSGKLLTVGIGHHDGMKQSYRGYTIESVGKVVGAICMCQFMILLDEKVNLDKGEYIYIFKGDNIYELSKWSKVSVYEILATLGPRIKREYNINKV